jgi:hypothetical protein
MLAALPAMIFTDEPYYPEIENFIITLEHLTGLMNYRCIV